MVFVIAVLAALLSTSQAVAGTPTGDGFGDMQELDVQASPPIAGAGVIFDFQQTYWNTFGPERLRSPMKVSIHFPRGTVWNGRLFPQCDPARLRRQGPVACPRNSRFATADVVAAIARQGVRTTARVTDFVGRPLDGHPTQLLYVVPSLGSPFVLTGVISDQQGRPYGPTITFDLTKLPGGTPTTPSPIVIVSIHNVDFHTNVTRTVRGKVVHTPLIVAPPTCGGFWYYAFDSVYASGPSLTSTNLQPCVPASARPVGRLHHL